MKSAKHARLVVMSVALTSMVAAALWMLSRSQYIPSEAQTTATSFVEALQRADFGQAYALTDLDFPQNAEEFEAKVRNELGDPTLIESYEINFVRPKQTYGNRIRRWYRNQELNLSPLSVDTTLIGHGGSLVALFEVRLKHFPDGHWRVVYFQSHAG
jgi:hypothetical protein